MRDKGKYGYFRPEIFGRIFFFQLPNFISKLERLLFYVQFLKLFFDIFVKKDQFSQRFAMEQQNQLQINFP